MRHLLLDNHEPRKNQLKHVRRAVELFRALLDAGIVEKLPEPLPDGRQVRLVADLQLDFALNQPLSPFALAVVDDLLDPESVTYALDVVSVIESTLDEPMKVLLAQRSKAKGEAVQRMKADGIEYEERMELLEDVEWPQPLAEELRRAYETYRAGNPWVGDYEVRPKSVVRDMYERAMTFGDYVAHYQLARSEGLVLRYLSDAYKALKQTVPDDARTEELTDLVEWLGEVVRQTDSSLLAEWEALRDGVDVEDVENVVAPQEDEAPPVTANARAFRVLVRNAVFRFVELCALDRPEALAALDGSPDADTWADQLDAYYEEHETVGTGTGPDARGPHLLQVDDGSGPDAKGSPGAGTSGRSWRTPRGTGTGGSSPRSTSTPPTRPAPPSWRSRACSASDPGRPRCAPAGWLTAPGDAHLGPRPVRPAPQPRFLRRRPDGGPAGPVRLPRPHGGRAGQVVRRCAAAHRAGPRPHRPAPGRLAGRPGPRAERQCGRQRRVLLAARRPRRGGRRHRPRLRGGDGRGRAVRPPVGLHRPHGPRPAGGGTGRGGGGRHGGVLRPDGAGRRRPRDLPDGPVPARRPRLRRGARARDPVLVDGAHVPLMLADPLAGVDCDVWVGNLHKFGCAPRGSGVLVARGPVRGQLHPLIDSWGAGKPFPASFDEQGTLDFTSWLAAPDALDAVEREVGWKVVREDAAALVAEGARLVADAFAGLTGEDHRVDVGMPATPFRLVRLPGRLGLGPAGGNAVRDRVLAAFDVEAAFTAFGGQGFVRLSAHAYNTLDDYADFARRCVPALVGWSRERG